VAGSGNNGGDALVMARQAYLFGFSRVAVIMAREKMNEEVRVQRQMVEQLGIPLTVWEAREEKARAMLADAEILFDGISGTGIKGALREPLASLVNEINTLEHTVRVAIDVPSGVGEGFEEGMPALQASLTLTMGLPKLPLYSIDARPYAGRIERIDLGFPPELLRDPPDAVDLIEDPEPLSIRPEAYKNTRGHCAVFCGAQGTTGAAALSAEAAARCGTGLTTLFIDEDIYTPLAAKLSSVMVKLHERIETGDDLKPFTAVLAGSGWGVRERDGLLRLLLDSGLPGVLDADGIRVLRSLEEKEGRQALRKKLAERWICTPHPGEFRVLADTDRESLRRAPLSAAAAAAAEYGMVVLLKSHVCYIAAPDGRTAIADGMNPAMGTGGSGDILAGLAAGLLAAGAEPFDAACRAAGFHQQIGKLLHRKRGWFLAEDMLPYISVFLSGGSGCDEKK
jgi:NAD(P)H-hydrate epimerase